MHTGKEPPVRQSNDTFNMPLHLQNPWTRELYRQYQAELKYSPSMIAMNEEEIEDASRTLNYLHSDQTKAYLKAHPDKKDAIDNRRKNAISRINRNRALIANHEAVIRSMRDKLIRYGFLDELGNSLFEQAMFE